MNGSAAPPANVVSATPNQPNMTADPPRYNVDGQIYIQTAGINKYKLLEKLNKAMDEFKYMKPITNEVDEKKLYETAYGNIKQLLIGEAGKLVNICLGGKHSPFMSACYSGSVKLVEFILTNIKGVEINDITPYMTPLNSACSRFIDDGDNIEMVKYLVSKGADVTKADGTGITALMCACDRGQKAIVDYLLDITKNTGYVNRVTTHTNYEFFFNKYRQNTGITALMIASRTLYPDIVKSLLEYGADFNMQDKGFSFGFNRFTALDYAKRSYEKRKHEKTKLIIDLLEKYKIAFSMGKIATNPAGVGGTPSLNSSRPTGPKPPVSHPYSSRPIGPKPLPKSWFSMFSTKNPKSRKNRKSRKSHNSRKSRKTRRN